MMGIEPLASKYADDYINLRTTSAHSFQNLYQYSNVLVYLINSDLSHIKSILH